MNNAGIRKRQSDTTVVIFAIGLLRQDRGRGWDKIKIKSGDRSVLS